MALMQVNVQWNHLVEGEQEKVDEEGFQARAL
jgi:hypothetical protein